MKPLNYLRTLAIFLPLLVISLPITFAEEFNRAYDGDGNLISDGKYYREYDGLNQLIRVRLGNTSTSPILEEYKWHPVEERIVVKKIFYNGVYNYTVYYPTKEYVRIINSSGTFDEKYVYQDGVLVAQIDTDGNKQFIHADHEGSNTLITDLNGNVLENTFYSLYGEIISGGTASRFDYEGKEFDSLTDRLDFGFRQIDPKVPVWDKPDTLIQNVYDPQSLNRYSFERNNPYGKVDPSGHLGEPTIVGIGSTVLGSLIVGVGIGTTALVIGFVGLIVVTGLIISSSLDANEAENQQIKADYNSPLTGKNYKNKQDWLDHELPRGGDFPFENVPPKDRPGEKYKYDKKGRPEDKKGNKWERDKDEKHWDVQHPDGSHTRVNVDGKILPIAMFFKTGEGGEGNLRIIRGGTNNKVFTLPKEDFDKMKQKERLNRVRDTLGKIRSRR